VHGVLVASAEPGQPSSCRRADYQSGNGSEAAAYRALVVSAAIDPRGEAQDALQAAEGRAVASERERRPSGRPGRAGNGCRQS
jgi:hypothetical protein